MKRRIKPFLFLMSLLCLGVLGAVISKIQRDTATPFPGAVVVLEDGSWNSRAVQFMGYYRYLWATTDTVLYTQAIGDEYHVIRRRIQPDGTAAPPEVLPVTMKNDQDVRSLSPDGKILCLSEPWSRLPYHYTLVRTDGQGKPVWIASSAYRLLWSPDSRFLYATQENDASPRLECFDAQTGKRIPTAVLSSPSQNVDSVTPEGRLLSFDYKLNALSLSQTITWKVTEVQGDHTKITNHNHSALPNTTLRLSPTGRQLLWRIPNQQITWLDKLQQRIMRKAPKSLPTLSWQVTDVDGKNEHTIGMTPNTMATESDLLPRWTPDGKGVYFTHGKKLWYLPVP